MNVPKSGLAARMRAWMAARTGNKAARRFTVADICDALGATPGKEHDKILKALLDFERRGEIERYYNKKYKRRQLLYVQDWRRVLRGTINRKIYKAMYVSGSFAVADLQRLTGLQERDYLDKLTAELKKSGYLQAVQRRRCAHGAGAETVWHVVNRDRFKLEVMR